MFSIIIPAYNEEDYLPATLDAAKHAIEQSQIECELIVVDDNSSDRTAEVASEMGAIVYQVACRQIAGARNGGARIAKGDVFLFVDADTLITDESLVAVQRAVERGAAGGGTVIRFDRPCPLWALMLARPMMISYRLSKVASGAFLYCRRDVFESIGGFDELYYAAEELILSRAIGKAGQFVFLSTPVVSSSRKLRVYSGFEIIKMVISMIIGGRRWAKRAAGKEIWYGERRPDNGTK
jgi:glycosyltransferase involved in cell wall biosynthesis